MRALKDQQLAIGQDVYLGCFGYDDIFEGTSAPLTLIKQPVGKIADQDAKLVLIALKEIESDPALAEKKLELTIKF